MDQFRKGYYYFSDNYTIILLNGFCDKPMKLPFYVSNWLFAMEVTRQEYYVETIWGVIKGKKFLYAYPLDFDSIQSHHKNCWDYLTLNMKKLQLSKITISWPYEPLGIFIAHLKSMNSKDSNFIRMSMNKFEDHRNNPEIGSYLLDSLLETSCMAL